MQEQTPRMLATRHDPNYIKLPHRFPHLHLWLSLVSLVVALTWLGFKSFGGNQEIYSKGTLVSSHAFFADRCMTCHEETPELRNPVTDKACLLCHDAPPHQNNQLARDVPKCYDCHVEHQGLISLVHTADRQCARCHENLKAHTDNLIHSSYIRSFAPSIVGFNTDNEHRKFISEEKEFNQPPAIIFHHGIHVGQKLRTLTGEEKILDCDDCHRPVAAKGQSQWKYAEAGFDWDSPLPADPAHRLHRDWGRDSMTMPNYEQHCASCHFLRFDQRITESVPHPKQPAEVRVFLVSKFKDYFDHNPIPPMSDLQIPEHSPASRLQIKDQVVEQSVACAERLLWGNSACSSSLGLSGINGIIPATTTVCAYCHQLNVPTSPTELPAAIATVLKPPLMPHAVFSHEVHIGVTCRSCHQFQQIAACCDNQNSKNKQQPGVLQRSEVNMRGFENVLPHIVTCRNCHSGSPASSGKTENGCYLCHQYHKWNPQNERLHVPYTIQQLTGKVPLDSVQMEKQSGNQ